MFNRKVFDIIHLLDINKVRLMWWIKAIWRKVDCSFLDLYRFPNGINVNKGKSNPHRSISWSKPEAGFMKFNVDGTIKGKPGPHGLLLLAVY